MAVEANFDGLVGPTHNYAGLSFGNVASQQNEGAVAQPRAAALQGLAKMKALADLGLVQGVLPPHDRPHVPTLREFGFRGTDAEVVERAATQDPALFAHCASASAMWTANAATVSPSADTDDGKVHFSVANLTAKLHRAIEHGATAAALRATFNRPDHFVVHDALPSHPDLGDEGAANHTRLCSDYGRAGAELFVYGRAAFRTGDFPKKFPARQTLEASQSIARRHGLAPGRTVYAQQSPEVIDAGVFHNDVISVGNLDVLFFHELAFVDPERVLSDCDAAMGGGLRGLCVSADEVPLADAVKSYLFNTQLVSLPDLEEGGGNWLIAPSECQEIESVRAYLEGVSGGGIIDGVHFFELRQSMRNGGGPACLRLRVALTEAELRAVNPGSLLTDETYDALCHTVEQHYRETLSGDDLRDPALLTEARTALDEFTQILGLGTLYEFQR